MGCPRSPARFCCHSLGSQYQSLRQKAAGSRRALQQRHEVLKAENSGGGYQMLPEALRGQGGGAGPRVCAADGTVEVGRLALLRPLPGPHNPHCHPTLISLRQMLLTCRAGSCWPAWTRWPATWTGRRRPSQGSCGRHWSRAGPCRTVLSGLRTSRYPRLGAQAGPLAPWGPSSRSHPHGVSWCSKGTTCHV